MTISPIHLVKSLCPKKSIGFFFLICSFTPFITGYFWLNYIKTKHQEKVSHQIETESIAENELVVLQFTQEEILHKLRWEHAREFEYEGQMYDIVESKTVGDSVYYWCWWDQEETRLNEELARLAHKNSSTNPQSQNNFQLEVFLESLYFQEVIVWHTRYTTIIYDFSIFYNANIKAIYHTPPKPPPQIG